MNPMQLMKLKGNFGDFKKRHQRLTKFVKKIGGTMEDGTVIEIAVTSPAGETVKTNMKVTPEDMSFFESIRKLG
ncbi:MAG: hypothetical protein HFH14_01270 [Lachnospiraceae bacterium]|nr:hypothetical protein [Lachnospiraceae bacterium]